MYDIVNNMQEIVDLYNRINSDKKESSWDWNVEMAAAA
jgi:hypothetical protein